LVPAGIEHRALRLDARIEAVHQVVHRRATATGRRGSFPGRTGLACRKDRRAAARFGAGFDSIVAPTPALARLAGARGTTWIEQLVDEPSRAVTVSRATAHSGAHATSHARTARRRATVVAEAAAEMRPAVWLTKGRRRDHHTAQHDQAWGRTSEEGFHIDIS